jgi:GxxExxY protein
MPIILPPNLRCLGDAEFRQTAYEVMEVVFQAHNQLGSLFDETIYHRAIANAIPKSEIEVPITVSFEDFKKTFYVDLLVANGVVFELKTVEALNDQHRAQLLNYLLLMELPHGKLVNLSSSTVQHEFINAPLRRADRVEFSVNDEAYLATTPDSNLRELVISILRDWGTCLDVQLYAEAFNDFMGDEVASGTPIEIRMNGSVVGHQKLSMLSECTSLCVTTIKESAMASYFKQLRSFIRHTNLENMQWINISRKIVAFTTVINK